MKSFKEVFEATFSPQDVMGYPAFVVTNGKEIFSETGEVQKFSEHDVWKSPKKYNGFLFTDKKEADALAKEISVSVKEIRVSTKI